MLDKNGVEIKTGAIVRISGAFFKNDNGLWLVTNSPADPSWCGSDHGLVKISSGGKISTAKYRHGSWPLMVFTNDRFKRAEATAWNNEHAEIEVLPGGVRDWSGVRDYFETKAQDVREALKWDVWNFGESSETARRNRVLLAHYEAVAAGLPQ